MATGFSFAFSGEDIEADEEAERHDVLDSAGVSSVPDVPAQLLHFETLLASLPSQISYSHVEVESPLGKKLQIPRRELFDVRVQLAAEDDDAALANLNNADIRTNVYEGGFKIWECSLDLARLLLDRGPRRDLDDLSRVDHVIELGCGAALPTLILFNHALASGLPLHITLTDFNADVLRLVTLPNLLLTWCLTRGDTLPDGAPNPLLNTPSGELDVNDALKDAFVQQLREQHITLTFVAGSWSPSAPFAELIPSAPEMNTLVLACETIYSPSGLVAFADALTALLRRVRAGRALVAAKRIYFGVGGGVDGFKAEASRLSAVVSEIDGRQLNMDLEVGGVKRCIMEVQMM